MFTPKPTRLAFMWCARVLNQGLLYGPGFMGQNTVVSERRIKASYCLHRHVLFIYGDSVGSYILYDVINHMTAAILEITGGNALCSVLPPNAMTAVVGTFR